MLTLITGASRGIGKFLFEKFMNSGEKVLGTYNLTQPETDKLEFFSKVDISSYKDVVTFVDKIKDEISELTLINCAGNNYNSFAHKADIAEWGNVINVNLIGTFNVIRAVLPFMREEGFGRIINFSSIVAQMGIPGTSAYAASKAGLWGLTKSISVENAKKGITINSLNLGYFDIGMIKEVPEKFQEIIKEKIPGGNFGNPDNIYKAVRFFMESDYINGTSVDINGAIY